MKILLLILITFQTCLAFTRDDDSDGIPTRVELEHGLHPRNASDANLDKDGDGFSNLTEFSAGTDMSNPKDFPPLATQLKLIKITKRYHPFVLRSIISSNTPKGQATELNAYDLEKKKDIIIQLNGSFLKNYRFLAYKKKGGKGFAVIEFSKGKALSLPINNKKIFKDFIAHFNYTIREKATLISLSEGQEFTLKNGKFSQSYLLKSVQEKRATIQGKKDYEFSLPKKKIKTLDVESFLENSK